LDGVVRHDWPLIEDQTPIPSLALSAANKLAPTPEHAAGDASHAGLMVDRRGRRWLRFYAEGAFEDLRPASLLATPELIANRIVIAGRDTPRYATPVGELTGRELIAQILAGYREQAAIDAGPLGPVLAWTATAALLMLLGVKPPRRRTGVVLATAGGATALLAWSATSFVLGSLWLPVAGPVVLLAVTGGLDALRRQDTEKAAAEPEAEELVSARRLAARGELEQAWTLYREIPASRALLGELYDLGCALEASDHRVYAGHIFHRIAQVDAHFRDIARRLVRSRRPPASPATSADHFDNAGDRRHMPRLLGRYELLDFIGRGAMGHVYLGRDPKINRIVAIKAIDLAAEFEPIELGEASRRFLREAETAGRLNHPNIVTIYDVGEANGLAYIAMEYLRGRHLSEFALPDTLLPPGVVLELLARTADALDYAHKQNVVHRDIKPANIMYDSVSDGLKITDFGIARLIDVSRTRTGIVLGTPAFMSPEQLEGKNVNGHTDLFALGVSLYQLLTGHLPFRGASMTKLMFVIANEPHESVTAVRADLPPCLDAIIDRALAKDPGVRFQTGTEMAAALRGAAAQLG
jgi:serine/threonine-protein kinase